MLYVICYDIEDNKVRNKISHLLQGYGKRVQKSVFECELDDRALQKLKRSIESRAKLAEQDSIRIYALCQTCKMKAVGLGKHVSEHEQESLIYL